MDFVSELEAFLYRQGYRKLRQERKILWGKEEGETLALIEVIPERLRGQAQAEPEEEEAAIRQTENQLMICYHRKVSRLTLRILGGIPGERELEKYIRYPDVWCVDRGEGRLLLYEYQKPEFFGIRQPLEHFLEKTVQKEKEEERAEVRRMLAPVNTVLVLVNIAVFVILGTLGDQTDAAFMAEHGAMTWGQIMVQGEFYRLFTSQFLHFGIEHLIQNMLTLAVIGPRLERIVGKWRYLALYLGSGTLAAVASLAVTLAKEPYTVAAGASGAIFGVMGGLLFIIVRDVVRKKRNRMREIGLTGILFMIGAALSYGFFESGVDNAAHIGGLVAGFLLTAVLTQMKKR